MMIVTAGKGGTGKTTVLALLLATLPFTPKRILVVDADPVQTLHLALGIPEPSITLSQVMDEIDLSADGVHGLNMTLEQHAANQLAERGVLTQHMVGGKRITYMAMGRGHKTGCYCQINNLLGRVLKSLWSQFDLTFLDAEAGIEHLNRKRIPKIDFLLLIATPHRAALNAAARVQAVINDVGIDVEATGLIINRASNRLPTLPDGLLTTMEYQFALADCSPRIEALEARNAPIVELDPDSTLSKQVAYIGSFIKLRALGDKLGAYQKGMSNQSSQNSNGTAMKNGVTPPKIQTATLRESIAENW